MSTVVAGPLAVTPLYATPADAIVSWDDPGQTWRSLGTLGAVLSPGGGGTGTSTVFTAGSVVFAGASGVYAQDNANLFWDDGNNRLGIGTASPATKLDAVGTIRATASTTPTGGAGLELFYSGGVGYLVSYDRGGAAGRQLYLSGSSLALMDGNVGIGTSSPGTTLDIGNGTTATVSTRLNSVAGAAAGGCLITLEHGSARHSYFGDYSIIFGGAYDNRLVIHNSGGILLCPSIAGGGNVGIGTTAPAQKVHISSGASTRTSLMMTDGNTASLFLAAGASLPATLAADSSLAFRTSVSYPNADTGVLAMTIAAGSGATANISGAWTTISAREMKEEIAPYTRGLDAIVRLQPRVFRYRAGTPFAPADAPSAPLIGLIADEVEPHVPEIVGETMMAVGDKADVAIASLEGGLLLYAVINGIKELAARVEALEARP